MQTFLPFPDFQSSARCLDDKRLGKQRIEALQILEANLFPELKTGWNNHPAVEMWRGYEMSLCLYGIEICQEWILRGKVDSCRARFLDYLQLTDFTLPADPYWLGNEDFHKSHQSNLVRKDSQHYRKFFPEIPDNLPYIWPKGRYSHDSSN